MAQKLPLVTLGAYYQQLQATDELPNIALPTNPVLKGVASVTVPMGATTDRPASPASGEFRFNETLGYYEGYSPQGWVRMSNKMVQSFRGNVGQSSGTTRIPYDTTPPLSTEGTQLWAQAITPSFVGSFIDIDFSVMVDCSSATQEVTLTLYRGTTLVAFDTTVCSGGLTNAPNHLRIKFTDVSTSLTAVTYMMRIGNNTTGTWYVGRGSTNTQGGVNAATWSIDEILP